MHDYFRGNPDGRNPLEFLADREPIRPEYRDRDARVAVLDAAGPRGRVDVPDARHALRGAAAPRRRGVHAHVHRVQPLARGGLGLRVPGQDLRRAVPLARRPGLGDPRARVGDRPRRAHDRAAPGRAVHRATGRARPAAPEFDPFWSRVEGGRAHRRRARGRQRLHRQRLRARRLQRELRVGRRRARASRCCTWSGRSTTSSPASCSTASSPASRASGSRASRTAASSSPTCSASCVAAPPHPGLLPRGPDRDVPAQRVDQPVLGGRRRTRSRSSWAPTA